MKAIDVHGLSQRRAASLIGVAPKTIRRPDTTDNHEVRAAMRAVAEQRRRFGYRRIGLMLERQGMTMNHKKLYRLYSGERLTVRVRTKRKRAQRAFWGFAHADAAGAASECALVHRLRQRHVRRVAPVSRAHGRR